MTSQPVTKVLDALRASGREPKARGSEWTCRCPAHDDSIPSLHITQGDDGRALLHCFARCPTEHIVAAIGLTMRDLMPADSADADTTPRRTPRRGVASTRPPRASTPRDGRKFSSAKEAVTELERNLGPRAAAWWYVNAAGQPVGGVLRWDLPDGKKEIRPVSLIDGSWRIVAMPVPRPLYHLDELGGAERVIIAEGEKCADLFRALGYVATTTPHGAESAAKADLSVLAGKDVVIVPDNDTAGEAYACDQIDMLSRLTPQPTVRIVRLPNLPEAGDIEQFLEAHGGDAQAARVAIDTLIAATAPEVLEAPSAATTGFRPFPVHLLPHPVSTFIRDGARALGCDAAYIALPLLAALASAVGNARRIRLKRTWDEPCIVWIIIVGDSGTMKTPATELAFKALKAAQAAAFKEYKEKYDAWKIEQLRYKVELAAWKKDAKDNPDPGDPPQEPAEPRLRRYLVGDTTVEALAPLLLANPKGVLLTRDELGGWISSFDRYANGKGGDASHWLSMFNAVELLVDRKTGHPPVIRVPRAAVCVAGGIQPGALKRAIGREHMENGLAARPLYTMPPRLPKQWTEAELNADTESAITDVFARLLDMQGEADANGEVQPVVIPLSPAAKRLWIQFFNEHGREQAELSGDLAAVWSKLEAYGARLTLLVHLVRVAADDPSLRNPHEIDEESVRAGVALTRWFADEARRVFAMLGETKEEEQDRKLVDLIRRKGGSVTGRELMRSCRTFKKSGDAEAALQALVEQDIGVWEQPAPKPKGGAPAKRFRLIATTFAVDTSQSPVDATPAGDSVTGGSVSVNGVSGVPHAPEQNGSGPTLHPGDAGPSVDRGSRPREGDPWRL